MSIGDNLSPIKTLDKDTVWQLLEKHPFGRLAVEAGAGSGHDHHAARLA